MPQSSQAAVPVRRDSPVRRGVFGALAEGVRKLLAVEAAASVQGQVRDRQERASTRPSRDSVAAGRFSLVGLAEIRESLGDRWPVLSEKVQSTAETIIARHLVKGDVFERYDETSFVVLFAHLGPKEAEFKARVIRNEIARQLLGAEWAGLSKVDAACAELPMEALLSGEIAHTLAEAFRSAVPLPAEHAPGAEPGRTAARDRSEPGDDQQGMPVARAAAAPQAEAAAPAPAPGMIQAPRIAEGPVNLLWLYEPVWDFTQMTLLRFRLVGSEPPTGRAHPAVPPLEEEALRRVLEGDAQAVRKAATDMQTLGKEGRRLAIICPIHHASLGSEAQRTGLARLLREVPEPMRRLLTLEVAYPEDQLWSYGATAFYEQTKLLGIGWAACLRLDRPHAIPVNPGPIRAVSAGLGGLMVSAPDRMRLLDQFAARARAAKLDCGAYELSSRATVVSAAAAGFRFLSGEAVHPPVPDPAKGIRFEPSDLYRDLLS